MKTISEAVNKMTEKSVIGVKLESRLKEENRSSTAKFTVPPPNYPAYDFIRKETDDDREIDHIRGDGNCFLGQLVRSLVVPKKIMIKFMNFVWSSF